MSKFAVSQYGVRSTLFALVLAGVVDRSAARAADRPGTARAKARRQANAKADKLLEPDPAQPRGPDRNKRHVVPIDGDPFQGPADAKVTIVKAYDYACPYCNRVRATMDELRAKYGDDVRIVYKQFVVHPKVATAGALAFCAADKQGKAFEMDALLWDKGFKQRRFDKDRCWESAGRVSGRRWVRARARPRRDPVRRGPRGVHRVRRQGHVGSEGAARQRDAVVSSSTGAFWAARCPSRASRRSSTKS